MKDSFQRFFEILTRPDARLPLVEKWLRENVWSESNFRSLSRQEYLTKGEREVLRLEEVILNSAWNVYDEIVAASINAASIFNEIERDPKTAVVVFDGCSIREVPLLIDLAEKTGFKVMLSRFDYGALPSTTESYVEQRILGKKLAPSHLPGRKELKSLGISAYYYDTSIRSFELSGNSLLLWSSFPDGTYMNFEARSANHFEAITHQFDVAWKNTVLAVPRDHRIIITSDHGYAYFGAGLESERKAQETLRILDNDRFKEFDGNGFSFDSTELQVIPSRRVAMLRGRIKNRPQGPAANKVFRHGGMSLMEMLTPWIELRRA